MGRWMNEPKKTLLAIIVFASTVLIAHGDIHIFISGASANEQAPFNEAIALPLIPNDIFSYVDTDVAVDAPVVDAPATTTVAAEEQKPEEPKKELKAAPDPSISSYGRLVIPSISLSKNIAPVGLTATHNMDVLNDTKHVGWYSGGAKPGQIGSAVLDAHVFQSFAKLKDVKIGDDIFVEQKDGSKLRFVVKEVEVYAYTDTAPLNKIFARNDTARLNLITCYGQLTSDHSTYTHRLVVYATLAERIS
jgi:LPXTG-site transpeptidase (sortase) family protein